MIALHVAHYWEGGLGRWVADFRAGDAEESYLLNWDGTSDTYGITYYLHDKRGNVIESFSPKKAIKKVDVASPELYEWVLQIANKYRIEMLVFSTLFGFSVDLLKLPLKKLVIVHDFMYVCAGTFGYFNSPCVKCDREDLKRCIDSNPATSLFAGVSFEEFVRLRDAFMAVAKDLIFVAPTNDTAKRIRAIEPRFNQVPIEVIPHGLSTEFPDCFGGAEPGRKLRLVFLGRYLWYKGWPVLEKVLPDYADRIDFYMMGAGEQGKAVSQAWSKEVIPSYEQKDLPGLLSRVRPDVGLLFSLVPETYSYTLTELLHARIPVIAPKLGALEERVHPHFGFPAEPSEQGLRRELDRVLADRNLLVKAHQQLVKENRKTAAQMSQEYKALLFGKKA